MAVEGNCVPTFKPHVKFRFDERRDQWLVLAPERMLVPDEISVEILKLVDGARSLDRIVDNLAEAYQAPRAEIFGDVSDLIDDLNEKGVLQL
ncbi:MAG: pyrroloquinoline quinone biosynthesis peptide chaperone PqqD [Magnetovibrionaceae bacterium]